ncbi:unnamed protein product [Rhizophagus irregularis]|nr:unnamed protein product [Rhizophagus irregularis]CAB4433766.1 unnamed protein product [Rhizophagus irregularis]
MRPSDLIYKRLPFHPPKKFLTISTEKKKVYSPSVSFTIIVAIIFIQALTPFTEVYADHTVFIQNKVARGSYTEVAIVLENKKGDFYWNGDSGIIDAEGAWTHTGYSLHVPDNVNSYWVAFRVAASTEEDKWRGPINNDGDKCWHFHGTLESWEVYEC